VCLPAPVCARARAPRAHACACTLQISRELSEGEAVNSLRDRFDLHQLERYKYYCYFLVALFEDIPLGAMNTYFFLRTVLECVETFHGDKSTRVCDLDFRATLVLLLSTPLDPGRHVIGRSDGRDRAGGDLWLPLAAATMTSAAMLGFKLAQAEALKREIDEHKRLEKERTALVAELEAALSPELALQVCLGHLCVSCTSVQYVRVPMKVFVRERDACAARDPRM